jgi:hypothetical protein
MRKLIILAISLVALAATTVLTLGVGIANASTVSTASDCKPVFAHTEYKWVPDVAYHRDGTKSQFIDSVTCAVSAPTFNLDVNTCSVTVPYTQGIDTFLYGVNGYPQTEAITHDVTVTGGLEGADGTAPQFWIGYQAQPGYVIANPGAAPTHFDFYNGDYVRDCISSATGDVTWNFQGTVDGTLKFNADQTGGSLDYTNSNGMWLHGVVTSYRQIDDHTAVFAGTITDGSADYTVNHEGPDYFFAKVVDGGTSGDQVAVLANEGPTDASGDYDLSLGSGIVTGGNLVVH